MFKVNEGRLRTRDGSKIGQERFFSHHELLAPMHGLSAVSQGPQWLPKGQEHFRCGDIACWRPEETARGKSSCLETVWSLATTLASVYIVSANNTLMLSSMPFSVRTSSGGVMPSRFFSARDAPFSSNIFTVS